MSWRKSGTDGKAISVMSCTGEVKGPRCVATQRLLRGCNTCFSISKAQPLISRLRKPLLYGHVISFSKLYRASVFWKPREQKTNCSFPKHCSCPVTLHKKWKRNSRSVGIDFESSDYSNLSKTICSYIIYVKAVLMYTIILMEHTKYQNL